DVAARTTEGVGQDFTVVQDQALRIDPNIAATAKAAFDRGGDLRVNQPDHTWCIQSDVTSIGRDCPRGDAAVGHGDLIACGDLDVACQASTAQAIRGNQTTV